MDGNSEGRKEFHTGAVESSKNELPAESSETAPDEVGKLTRRSLLVAAGAATASLAGCTGSGNTGAVELQSLGVYGYGGKQVMANSSETVTVTESEPNDTRQEAMSVSLGTEIMGELETADVDWFAFDADEGQTVVAEFTRSVASGVTSLILYGPGGDYRDLIFVGTGDPTQLVETVGTTGTYYIEVVDVEQSAGEYTLRINSESESTPTPTATATPTVTETQTATSTPIEDDHGEQGYGEYGYGGVDA
jgi:hypothetical protein